MTKVEQEVLSQLSAIRAELAEIKSVERSQKVIKGWIAGDNKAAKYFGASRPTFVQDMRKLGIKPRIIGRIKYWPISKMDSAKGIHDSIPCNNRNGCKGKKGDS